MNKQLALGPTISWWQWDLTSTIKVIWETLYFLKTFNVRTNFTDANMWYKNLDKLIKNINMNSTQYGMHLLYSTPSCYLKVKHTEFNWVPSNGVMSWPFFFAQNHIFLRIFFRWHNVICCYKIQLKIPRCWHDHSAFATI